MSFRSFVDGPPMPRRPLQHTDHLRSRRPRAQPQQHQRRAATRQAHRVHRAVRVGQVEPRLRHDLRRGPAPLRRVAASYARQFLGQMDKPDVDVIEGLSPAISIDQKSASRNPRSTVGTITEVYDYLRLLYARIGIQHCPNDGTRLQRQTPQQIVDRILLLPEGTRFQVLAPVVRGRKGEYDTLLEDLAGPGLRPRPDRRRGRRHRRVPQARRAARPLRAAQDRGRRRPPRAARGHRAAAHRLARDGAQAGRRRRRGRDRRHATARTTDRRPLTFSQHLACPTCGTQLRGAGAAQLLVQLALRRVRDVRRPRHDVRDRPRAGHPRPRPVDQRRRDRAVAHAPTPSTSRGCSRPSPRPTASTSTRRGRTLTAKQQKVILHGVEGNLTVKYKNRYGRAAPVLDDVRGRHPVDQAPPRGRRERLDARAVRGLHAPGAVPGVRRRPAQAGDAGGHRQRPQHRRGLRRCRSARRPSSSPGSS